MNRRNFSLAVQKRTGSAIIFLVVVTSLLLVTTTTAATFLSVSELQQASNIERSDQAYYAAEAGIEEALRRLDLPENRDRELNEIFPEQFDPGCPATADQATILDGEGALADPMQINCQTDDEEIGQLAWRQRRIYDSTRLDGTQVKDETVEFDASALRRRINNVVYGQTGTDSDGSNIFTNLEGLEYCWVADKDSGTPDIEFTVVSWPQSNAQNVATNKAIFSTFQHSANFPGIGQLDQYPVTVRDGETCTRFTGIDSNRRYIFRIRPLFYTTPSNPNPNTYTVQYRAKLLDARNLNDPLYMPNNMIDIDVVGQSGEIRRRIVARKLRNGRLLGIFDYVLYSGDPNLPLCKSGVQQTDVGYDNFCQVNDGGVHVPNLPPLPPPTASDQSGGCTNPAAFNYDATVSTDDGSCIANIAHNKPATKTNGEASGYVQCSPACLTDGNQSTMYYPGSWGVNATVDLGAIYRIDQAKVVWGNFGFCVNGSSSPCASGSNYVTSYNIQASENGITWYSLGSGSNPNATQTTTNTPVARARYLRLDSNSSNHWFGVYEIMATGELIEPIPPTNVALHKAVTASNYENHGYWYNPPSTITDGNIGHGGYSPGSRHYDIVIDLGRAYNLSSIVAHWGVWGCWPGDPCSNGYQYINNYGVYTSSSPYGPWNNVYSANSSPRTDKQTFTGSYSNARYVRVNAWSGYHWIRLPEVEVFGN